MLVVNWSCLIGQFQEAIIGVTITEFPDAGTYTAVVSLVEATGAFSEIKAIELLTASEIDRGLGKTLTYRAPGA